MSTTFQDLNLTTNIIEGLQKQGINLPTPIQKEVIPLALENKDVVGQSQTGSGKTLAYLLPLFQKIDTNKKEMQTIILAPTHELAIQIDRQIKLLATNSEIPLTSAVIIGEVNITRQIEKLKSKPHIIVGSTGRILELIKRKKISAHTIKTIVIDEGDKMLNDANIQGVKEIIKKTRRDRQIMAFSATITEKTLATLKDLLSNPRIIKITKEVKEKAGKIEHFYFLTEQREKIILLRKIVHALQPQKAIIFINKGDDVQITTTKLQYHHLKVAGIHGSMLKEDRKKAMDNFRRGKVQLLVASDIAARGLDLQGVTHIINLDLPPSIKEYLHRVGRTGRMGESGTAISLVTKRELPFIKKYEKDLGLKIEEKKIFKGVIKNKH